MKLTELRPANVNDEKRASHILSIVRARLLLYRNGKAAQAGGYFFANHLVAGDYYEVMRRSSPRWFVPFDLQRPVALLYSPRSAGREPILVGASYAAFADSDGRSLDALIPLSVARWSQLAPRCAIARERPWSVEIFPFERNAAQVWRTPRMATYFEPTFEH